MKLLKELINITLNALLFLAISYLTMAFIMDNLLWIVEVFSWLYGNQ